MSILGAILAVLVGALILGFLLLAILDRLGVLPEWAQDIVDEARP